MTIDPYILAFSAITVIVTVWMGFRSAKQSKTASDFFVAGRSVGVGMNASAISGEYLSAASFMGVAGMVMSSGYDALWYPVCYACGYLFLLLFIAGPLRRFGAYTIPDFAEGRFDSPLFRKIAVVFVLFIGFFYTMPQMKGAGTTLAYIFPGLPYWAGVVLVGAVITLNVALGGMKGITLVQAFQYWIKMFAISVPIFVLMAVYGGYGAQLKLTNPQPGPVEFGNKFEFSVLDRPLDLKLKPGMSFKELITYVRQEARQFRVKHSADDSFPAGTVKFIDSDLAPFMNAYSVLSARTILKANVDYPNSRFTFSTTNTLTRGELVMKFEAKLAESKLALISYGDDIQILSPVARTNEIARYLNNFGFTEMVRKPLPEKAPADATWLNPFGPLTTKAAKAAAAGKSELDWSKRSQLSDPLPFVQTKPNLLRDLDQFTEKLRSTPSGGSYTWNTNEPVWMVSSRLKSAAGLVDVLCDTNLLLKTLLTGQPRQLGAAESVAFVEDTLKEHGASLIRASKQEWWIVPTAEFKSYFKPLDTKPYALLYTYSLIIAIVCGTAGLPHILVRFYTNPDGVAAKRTTMWVMILIGVFYVFPPVFGVIGRNLLPELYSGVGAKGTDKIVLELPRIISERYGVLGSILSGITCAGAFAAFMSTFSGLLVSMTGALAHDVYGRMLNPKASPEQRMKMFKWCAVLIGGVAVLLGSFVEPLEINFMVGQAFAIAAASYFPLLFMAVWWRKLTMKGAATGMLTGGLSALVGISLTSFSTLASAPGKTGELFALFKPLNDFWAAHPLLRILCEQPAIWAVPLAIILMIVVSKLTSKDVPEDIRMKMLVLHAPEKLGLKQEYIQEHQPGH